MLKLNTLRALPQDSDSINRPCLIVLLVFTCEMAKAAAPYPRACASGRSIDGHAFYRAKTFIYSLSYVYIKKRALSKRPPPCSEGSIKFIYNSRNFQFQYRTLQIYKYSVVLQIICLHSLFA